MLKISYAGCFGLTPAISSQFSIEMCTASKYYTKTIPQEYTKKLIRNTLQNNQTTTKTRYKNTENTKARYHATENHKTGNGADG